MNQIVEALAGKIETTNTLITESDASVDLYFKMHQKVTAKSEDISKSYNQNILIKFDDIHELHYKTIQSINSLKPSSSEIGTRIAVFHSEGESENFNSFEEFQLHNKTSPNPTTQLALIYTFTLYDERTDYYENYKISCRMRSRIAELAEIESDGSMFIPKEFLASLLGSTAKITVEYNDYVKARTFVAMFDEWVKGCDESHEKTAIKWLRKIAPFIPTTGKYIIVGMLAWFTGNAIDVTIITNELSVKFIVFYASFFLVVVGVADKMLNWISQSIYGYMTLSYVEINKGDTKLIADYARKNRKSLVTSGIGLIGAILIGVFAAVTYDIIKILVL
jgi:hypothetical protein